MLLESNWIVYGLLASIIASVHLWIGWFESRFKESENRWIGFVGGIAVGYVTLYMLPKLSNVTVRFIAANPDAWWALQYRAYFILLLGIVVHLVFERVSRMSIGGVGCTLRWRASQQVSSAKPSTLRLSRGSMTPWSSICPEV